MTTKRQFIEYLESLPDDTEIRVIVRDSYDGFDWKPLDAQPNTGNIDFVDYTKNAFVKQPHKNYGKIILYLGE